MHRGDARGIIYGQKSPKLFCMPFQVTKPSNVVSRHYPCWPLGLLHDFEL